MRTLRRLRVPFVVAFARLRAHPGRALLVVLGVAAAQALLVGVLGGSAIARDRAVQNAVGRLPLNQRSFRIDVKGVAELDSVRLRFCSVEHE